MAKKIPEYEEIGRMLQSKRAALDLSQEDFADKLGYKAQTSIVNFEKGRLPKSAKEIVKLATRAGLDMAEVRRLLLAAWGLSAEESRPVPSAEERRLLRLYRDEPVFKEWVDGYTKAFLGMSKEAKRK